MVFYTDNYWDATHKTKAPMPNNMLPPEQVAPILQRMGLDTPPAPPPAPKPAGPSPEQILNDLLSKAPGMVSGVADKLFGISNQLVSDYNNSPEQILSRLRDQFPGYEYKGPSASSMASREFAPQFEILKQAAAQNEKRYGTNKAELSGLWGALANDVVNQRGQDAAIYNKSNAEIGNIYDQSATGMTNNMNSATQKMGDILALLGQNEAAPAVFQNKQELLDRTLSQNAASKNSAQELNRNLGANAFAYDTSRIANTKQAGLGAQQDLMQQYMDLQNQNQLKKLDVQSQQGAATNKYDMMIQDLVQGGVGARDKSINDAFQNILSSQNNNSRMELDRARLGLDTSKYESDLARQSQPDTKNLSPYRILLDQTAQIPAYSSNPQAGRQVADRIMQTQIENPSANLAQLMKILAEDPSFMNQPGVRELAYDFFYKVLADAARNR